MKRINSAFLYLIIFSFIQCHNNVIAVNDIKISFDDISQNSSYSLVLQNCMQLYGQLLKYKDKKMAKKELEIFSNNVIKKLSQSYTLLLSLMKNSQPTLKNDISYLRNLFMQSKNLSDNIFQNIFSEKKKNKINQLFFLIQSSLQKIKTS